jgi:ribosomal protein S27E
MVARIGQKEVLEAFQRENYILLSQYTSSTAKLEYICPQGHKHLITYSHFKKGVRCAFCSKRRISDSTVKNAFAKERYQLLSNFTKSNTPMSFTCSNGHEGKTTWNSFRSGVRCAVCSKVKVVESEVEDSFKKNGYQLLDKYSNSEQKLRFICPEGHQHSITWSHFRKGHRCAYCAGSIVLNEQVEEAFKLRGYTLLSKYSNHKSKLSFVCPNGHNHYISWNAFQQGGGCSKCTGRHKSNEEKEIKRIKTKIRHNIKGYLELFKRKNRLYDVGLRGKSQLAYNLATNIYKKFGSLPQNCELDHIVPQSFFDFSNHEEIIACWDTNNLRYLTRQENASRGNRLTEEEVKNFCSEQISILKIASKKPQKWVTHLSLNI